MAVEAQNAKRQSKKDDGFVKSPIYHLTVIPAKAGIQSFQVVADYLDSGFHRSDDFYEFIKDLYVINEDN